MALSNPSSFDRVPLPFDPKILRRSAIAIPLREVIEQEIAATDEFLKNHPKALEGHNAAVFHRTDYPGGLVTARKVVLERLAEAIKEIAETRAQQIDPYDPSTGLPEEISLARLDGRVIRTLLAIDSGENDSAIARIWPTQFDIVIDINLNFKPRPDEVLKLETPDYRVVAQQRIKKYIEQAKNDEGINDEDQVVDEKALRQIPQYVFARLEGKAIKRLVAIDLENAKNDAEAEVRATGIPVQPDTKKKKAGDSGSGDQDAEIRRRAAGIAGRFRAIHHIWPDFKIRSCIIQSIATIKVDAAHRSFTAFGQGITWAVMDSGIQGDHPHFRLNNNIDPDSPYHADFTDTSAKGNPLQDDYGHGTHVAGIIAGEQSLEKKSNPLEMVAAWRELDESNQEEPKKLSLEAISGMAPKCRLVSLKVLDRFGQGTAKSVIAALNPLSYARGLARAAIAYGARLHGGTRALELRRVLVVQAAMPSAVVSVIVARIYGGQPLIHEQEIVRNPLGPFQGWGGIVQPGLIVF